MRCTSVITEWYKNNWSNNDAVIHCAIDYTSTGFLGHHFTNGNDYRLCIAHRVCYYGLGKRVSNKMRSFSYTSDASGNIKPFVSDYPTDPIWTPLPPRKFLWQFLLKKYNLYFVWTTLLGQFVRVVFVVGIIYIFIHILPLCAREIINPFNIYAYYLPL